MVNAAGFLLCGRTRANYDDNCPVRSYLDGTRARLLRGSYGASNISLGEERGTARHYDHPLLARAAQGPVSDPRPARPVIAYCLRDA